MTDYGSPVEDAFRALPKDAMARLRTQEPALFLALAQFATVRELARDMGGVEEAPTPPVANPRRLRAVPKGPAR